MRIACMGPTKRERRKKETLETDCPLKSALDRRGHGLRRGQVALETGPNLEAGPVRREFLDLDHDRRVGGVAAVQLRLDDERLVLHEEEILVLQAELRGTLGGRKIPVDEHLQFSEPLLAAGSGRKQHLGAAGGAEERAGEQQGSKESKADDTRFCHEREAFAAKDPISGRKFNRPPELPDG